jgi:DNA-binding NarL/FixJ family response regulator
VIRRMPQFQDLPIVFLTAQALAEQREKSVEAGASAYLTKPVDLDLLLDTMSQWIVTGPQGNGRHAPRGGAHEAAPGGGGTASERDNGEPTVGGTS